jgi:hypothetical protein
MERFGCVLSNPILKQAREWTLDGDELKILLKLPNLNIERSTSVSDTVYYKIVYKQNITHRSRSRSRSGKENSFHARSA